MPPHYEVTISPQAEQDIKGIEAFIARRAPENAKRFVARMIDEIGKLYFMPYRHPVARSTEKLPFEVRRLLFYPYLVYFTVNDDRRIVRVLRVRHGAQTWHGISTDMLEF